MPFIDSNLFLRYLTRDDPTKAERVQELLRRAEAGEVTLFTTETTISELVYTLSSPRLYHLPRAEVRRLILPLISLKGLRLTHRRTFERALDLYATTSIDFADALMVAHMERLKVKEVYSYDSHFNVVRGIQRIEP